MSNNIEVLIPNQLLESKILFIRDKKVMLDEELAKLYGVETKQLNRAVKRNLERFPEDFMFQLNQKETHNLRCQIGTSSLYGGRRYIPFVFTEHGILMLSSVLKSKRAIQVNIQIMRTFNRLREIILTHKDLKTKIEKLEKKYNYQFKIVFDAIKELITEREEDKKKKFGFTQ